MLLTYATYNTNTYTTNITDNTTRLLTLLTILILDILKLLTIFTKIIRLLTLSTNLAQRKWNFFFAVLILYLYLHLQLYHVTKRQEIPWDSTAHAPNHCMLCARKRRTYFTVSHNFGKRFFDNSNVVGFTNAWLIVLLRLNVVEAISCFPPQDKLAWRTKNPRRLF